MPAVIANIIPKSKLLIYLAKNKYAITAPKNSEKPDINVYKIAFFLFLVE